MVRHAPRAGAQEDEEMVVDFALLGKRYAREERYGGNAGTLPAETMRAFFGATSNNTLYVLCIHTVYYVLYAVGWSLALHIDAVEKTIFNTNFNGAFSYTVWIMQGLYLASLYNDAAVGRTFFAMIMETRSLALKIGAYVRGSKCRAAAVAQATGAADPDATLDSTQLVDRVRGLLMVYTRHEFELFGVSDPTRDYERFGFAVEEQCAAGKFAAIRMNDEAVTSVLDGAQYELLVALALMRARNLITGDMYAQVNAKVDAIGAIKDQILTSRRPLVSPMLDAIPDFMLVFYVYVLVPLGVYSSVGKFWGIFIYAATLFFYNGRNVVARWLGNPFSQYARHRPLSFQKLRNQQYAMIELLLGTRDVAELVDDLDDTTLSAIPDPIGPDPQRMQ